MSKEIGKRLHGEVVTETGKILDFDKATSLIIPLDLLNQCADLEVVGERRDNKYFHVMGTNTCIAHIEEGFCVLTDYVVDTVAGRNKVLPKMLDSQHYGVYQVKAYEGHTYRDWVKNSCGNNRNIGQDIKYYIHGISNAPEGCTLDHIGATFDERERFKEYTVNNINNGSHRHRVHIKDESQLQRLVEYLRFEEYGE